MDSWLVKKFARDEDERWTSAPTSVTASAM